MKTHRLVLPGDLNQFGFLFGGRLLAWVDEASWIAASLQFPQCRFVTVAMDEVVFRHSVREGTILEIESILEKTGRTSVTYDVLVRKGRGEGQERIFSTRVSFVNVDSEGEKLALNQSTREE
ncbi:MAG: acyl-CoA thioesterase [Verrucomicrobiota bacterium JB023]|nr:acyl-CoA thioesterase [Verrucomicrobiota bacterium JB023]